MSPEGKLADRLRRLREAGKQGRPGPGAGTRSSSGKEVPGWKRLSDHVFIREKIYPSPFGAEGEKHFSAPFLAEGKGSLDNLVFYDLETTGLSTGAGVVAFLAGFGRIRDGKLAVKQFFLSDFPGEELFLRSIIAELEDESILVSYNGRTFDRHLLISRSLMNRLVFPSLPEIDLLHLSRRLWRDHIPSCSLSSVEENILGIFRVNDVRGKDIPDLYFSFQRTERTELLERIFKHHVMDIVSLASLFQHIRFIWENPSRCRGGERYSLGRLMLHYRRSEGETLLMQVWEEGRSFSKKAGILLSFYYKRLGRFDLAYSLWNRIWESAEDPLCGVELAKFYEHRKKDYKKALEITQSMLNNPGNMREKLLHRMNRLERRIGRANRR